MTDLLMTRAAEVSSCGKYRYSLSRIWAPKEVMHFVMVNPSTADADKDDATIRKCIGFAQRHHFGGIMVSNLFAFRAADVKELGQVEDPGCITTDGHNRAAMLQSANAYGITVFAWGARAKMPRVLAGPAISAAKALLPRPQFSTYRIGDLTKSGDPRHPLMTGYRQPLTAWPT